MSKKVAAPILDFVRRYSESGAVRFHMPGHKGKDFLGFEKFDITEIKGADSLYEADGIIAESEKIASELFGSGATFFSTEGSSQCVRAMLYLALTRHRRSGMPSADNARPVVVAARNVHKSFVYAAALLDFDVVWLSPETSGSICGCAVPANTLEEVLERLDTPPAAVYVTSPDYLGGVADISALSDICHRRETILLVDGAHGAYLHFLEKPSHPLDLGADICCDSAHKTLPALTGAAYLHISDRLSESLSGEAKAALELFGSTSPSYLTLASLDFCNRYVSEKLPLILPEGVRRVVKAKRTLMENGWRVYGQLESGDPLKITLTAPSGMTGTDIAERLRAHGIECEYADKAYTVLMASPQNDEADFEKLVNALGKNANAYDEPERLPILTPERAMTIREAMFSPQEMILTAKALGRISGAPTVSCPPAIPITVSGERISADAVRLFEYYGINKVSVICK